MFDDMHSRGLVADGFRLEDLGVAASGRGELVDGTVLLHPLLGTGHQLVVARLLLALAEEAPSEFAVLPAVAVGRRGTTDRVLVPDVAVVRAVALTGEPLWIDPEDLYLAAEVVSPSSRAVDLRLKRQLYSEWGTGAYWVVDPDSREVHRFGAWPAEGSWLGDVDLDVWFDV